MNGYTAILEEKDVSFSQFVWRCARAFGAFIHMKDDGLDTPPVSPKGFRSSYHEDRISEIKKDILKIETSSMVDLQARIDKEYNDRQAHLLQIRAEKFVLLNRINKMLEQVKAWNPPTKDHNALKDFMEKSLQDSIKFDCDIEYYDSQLRDNPKLSVEEWKKEHLKFLKDDIEYHTKHLIQDRKLDEQAIQWISDLEKSVPQP